MSLPPPPEPKTREVPGWNITYHSVDQMQAYGQACREHALEEAAMAAEDGFKYDLNGYQIADKIRSLK